MHCFRSEHLKQILEKQFPGNFRDGTNRVRKPYVCIPEIRDALVTYFKDNYMDLSNFEEIYCNIIENNDKLGQCSYEELCRNYYKHLTLTQYDMMKQTGFYLSLLEPIKWIQLLI